ncbi:MAG: N-6 DNA methylase [Candidatus Phytoplasma sp. TWB_XP]
MQDKLPNTKGKISIYGQELTDDSYNLVRMNMLMHAIDFF